MDFNQLITAGNLAFYQSCEVTEIFLCRKNDRTIFNLFTLVVFEENPYTEFNQSFLGDRIKVNEESFIGINRYWLTLTEIEAKFNALKTKNQWSADGKHFSQFPPLKYIPKQYIPATEGSRINQILKNNYHNGSYTIEFFDEDKSNFDFLLKMEALNKFNELCENIAKQVPINLSVARDRVGNFIFQFPITLLNIHSKALSSWEGVEINFAWHDAISIPPDCLLQVESVFDGNYMGAVIEDYNKTDSQQIIIGNLDQLNHIRIWRKEPSLILYSFSGTYIHDLDLDISMINHEPRIFEVDGEIQKVEVSSNDMHSKNKKRNSKMCYTTYINNNLYDKEKKQLEESLAFKQYLKWEKNDALQDIRRLIRSKGANGVYLWDPYLRADDIFKTLYYATVSNVPLRAITSTNSKKEKILEKDGKCKCVENVSNNKPKTVKEVINQQRVLFENTNNNNHRLNFEFRIQHGDEKHEHGWKFHDRFLIFPSIENGKATVYSLGTSLNSYGTEHNILQEVAHPQPIVDAFNELWDKLNHPDCLVWKHPK